MFLSIINPSNILDVLKTTPTGDFIPSDKCVCVLNDHFTTSFSSTQLSSLPVFPKPNFMLIGTITIDSYGIVKLIKNMKPYSSASEDNVNIVLKSTKKCLSISISEIFQQLAELGCLSNDWRAKEIPLHRNGDKHCTPNFRQISLTNAPCKILVHVIYFHLANFVKPNLFFFVKHNMAAGKLTLWNLILFRSPKIYITSLIEALRLTAN